MKLPLQPKINFRPFWLAHFFMKSHSYYFSLCVIIIGLVSCQRANDNAESQSPQSAKEIEAVEPRVDVPKKYIIGKFNPATDTNFVKIANEYADRSGMYLQAEAYEAFKKMHAHAARDGVNLQIRSATRNFDRQKQIWEAKWSGKRLVDGNENLAQTTPEPVDRALKILEWSSMPGTSRHHWGTDIDLNAFNNAYFKQGEGKKVYEWLQQHADTYGYCQPYTAKGVDRPDGYNEERWHWSYMPIAEKYLASARDSLSNADISGFKGSETASSIDVKEKYIFGVAHKCQAD